MHIEILDKCKEQQKETISMWITIYSYNKKTSKRRFYKYSHIRETSNK